MREIKDPWAPAEKEMEEAGYSLDKIPEEYHHQHIWSDGLLFWWTQYHRLPTAEELAFDMFDEWDDPVSIEEAETVLGLLQK